MLLFVIIAVVAVTMLPPYLCFTFLGNFRFVSLCCMGFCPFVVLSSLKPHNLLLLYLYLLLEHIRVPFTGLDIDSSMFQGKMLHF